MEKRAFKRRKQILAILVIFLIVISMVITVVSAPASVKGHVTVISSQSSLSGSHGTVQINSPGVPQTPNGVSSGGSSDLTSGSSGLTGGSSGSTGVSSEESLPGGHGPAETDSPSVAQTPSGGSSGGTGGSSGGTGDPWV